ncbi:MAG: hypothetical protein IK000_03305 [Bacteroidaceae bacterium]|nr:hypothetical protein [Bacteroidaceae bacterium]
MNKTQLRMLLNTLFLLGFITAFIIYFATPDRTPFFIVCGISIAIKLVEYGIRFFG